MIAAPWQFRSKTASAEVWQVEECLALSDLQAQGALRLEREAAWNAQAYLEARHIPLAIARDAGVGYVEIGVSQGNRRLQRWEDRLIIPLFAYDQPQRSLIKGFAGQLLWQWQCCQDETAHTCWLEQQGRDPWIQTHPAGWFWEPQHLPVADPVVVVQGAFDRLAVLADSGFQSTEVIALVGTALQPEWLSHAPALLLAVGGDHGEAIRRIEQQRAWKRMTVGTCQPPADGRGKAWNERWRQHASQGLEALYAYHALLAHDL